MIKINDQRRAAAVFKRRERFFIHPYNVTSAGVDIFSEPITVLQESVSHADLGSAVLDSLRMAGKSVPHPTNWEGVSRALYDTAGVKSWSEFLKGASSCTVDMKGDRLTIVCWINRGARAGFAPAPGPAVELSSTSSTETIGAAIMAAISRPT